MAEIYRATDVELGRDVAVKTLALDASADDDLRARFLREAKAAARLSGEPHTVSIYDVGELEGRPFLVMEYLPGGSLADRLLEGRVSRAQAFVWLEQAARALDNAHAHGVVHRDVKPGNLLIDASGNLSVADFGIARADGLESHTQTGVVLGTAGYLAPERTRGERATAASDRYALAVVAYELLAGSRPDTTRSAAIPERANEVFARALASRPESRFESCLAFVSALRDAFDSSEAPTVLDRRRSRSRTPAIAAVLVLAGAFGAIGAAFATRSDPPARQRVVRTVTVSVTRARPVADEASGQPSRTPASDHEDGHGPGKGHGKKKGKD
jgi:serine/threonine protein kinase